MLRSRGRNFGLAVVALAWCWPSALPLLRAPAALAQDAEPEPGTKSAKLQRLEAEFNDPLTTLPQIFTQDAYTPKNFGSEAQTNKVIVRAIIPRVPETSLLPFVQLIRPSISLVTVPTGKGSATDTDFGDAQLFDLAVIPWPARETGLYMGVGPIFIFPTATARNAGQGAWQVGPAFGTVYKGLPGFLFGALIQNPISFAYTSPDRQPVSTLFVQPIVAVYLGKGFYVRSADATWSLSWHHNTATLLPVSCGLGYVVLREDWPPLNFFVSGEWMAYRQQFAPMVAPQTTVRFGLTVAFPEFSPW